MPWGAYVNKVDREAFLAQKPALNLAKALVIEPRPMEFKSGKFGWQASKPNQKVLVALGKETVEAQIMVSSKADILGKTELTANKFLAASPSLDIAGIWEAAEVRQFSTSSIGWHVHRKQTVKVAGEELHVMVNFEAVLKGTKTNKEPAAADAAGGPAKEPAAAAADIVTGGPAAEPAADDPAAGAAAGAAAGKPVLMSDEVLVSDEEAEDDEPLVRSPSPAKRARDSEDEEDQPLVAPAPAAPAAAKRPKVASPQQLQLPGVGRSAAPAAPGAKA
uniref:Uncharacterized protein n=1 Tax=Alexandrium catenella TaxID=2925 RepID=A0A7S1ML43_ALECA